MSYTKQDANLDEQGWAGLLDNMAEMLELKPDEKVYIDTVIKPTLAIHITKAETQAEIRGMLAVNDCHGCVDRSEWLTDRLKTLQDNNSGLKEGRDE